MITSFPSQGSNQVIPYFDYIAHSLAEDGTDKTVPYHNYPDWSNPLVVNKNIEVCNLLTPGGQKTQLSCDNAKMLSHSSTSNNLISISDLLIVKYDLENIKTNLESQLIDPDTQRELVKEIKETESKLENIVVQLYELYKEQLSLNDAKLLLEAENYEEAKKLLIELYTIEGDFVKSREAQDDLEAIILSKPDYYYNTLEEKEAKELNDLYYNEINELLIQVSEDQRSDSELLPWEIYALNLIKFSNLPVAVKAESILIKNDIENQEHEIEKVSDLLLNYSSQNTLIDFDYGLLAIPNPAMTYTNVNVNIPQAVENASLELHDAYNNTGSLGSYPLNAGNNLIFIDVSTLNSGMYVLSVKIEEEVYSSTNLIVIN